MIYTKHPCEVVGMFSRFAIVGWESTLLQKGHRAFLCKRLARVTERTTRQWRNDLNTNTITQGTETITGGKRVVFCVLDKHQRLTVEKGGTGVSVAHKPIALVVAEILPSDIPFPRPNLVQLITPMLDSATESNEFKKKHKGVSPLEEISRQSIEWGKKNGANRVTINVGHYPELLHTLARAGLVDNRGYIIQERKIQSAFAAWWKKRTHTHYLKGFGFRKK
jgi:hypothetical protein